MINQSLALSVIVYGILTLHCTRPSLIHAQPVSKAIVMAWDGTVPAFVKQLVQDGKLPNLAKLIAGGAFADTVMPGYPSKTAPGFASLMTGAPPRVTGISGNRVPRAPRDQFTILESLPGFAGAPLRAEPIWATARRAGKTSVVSHIPSFAEERSESLVRFAGYDLVVGRDGIVTRRAIKSESSPPWKNPPASDAPPIEFEFTAGESLLFGLLIDDPADVQIGYDTAIISTDRDGREIKTKLKPAPSGPGGELFWSRPIAVRASGTSNAKVYFRLFDIKADGSDFFLYFTRPTPDLELKQDTEASPTVRTFIGNGASILYQNGALGRTVAHGGNGGAEARYLETILFAQHQLMETNRWAIENLPWDLFLAYTPFPDEAEHAWRGHLDTTLPNFRPDIAEKLRPFLEQVYRSSDEHLGMLLSKRPENTAFVVISDHGMQGIYKKVALNPFLQDKQFLVLDSQNRVDLTRSKIMYPTVNSGYLVINSIDRKGGIVRDDERDELVRNLREALFALRDGERQVVISIIDAASEGDEKGIGGEVGGDLYIELAPGYDFDPRLSGGQWITDAEPYGTHGASPDQASMRTLMVFNGPGIRPGQGLTNARLIDFAPTLAWILGLPRPKDATGSVLYEAFSETRVDIANPLP
ncbi:MAG TPA: alkaline phosphatase family protein [Candidatus Limnocylindrales bacterium]|nr:alkaline phosphatase family protein [Candidatus Limnocylindrales bacterium]